MTHPVDQADGLRRLLCGRKPTVIAFTGMALGAGATTAAMNVSIALAAQGKPVVLLDERAQEPNSACRNWSIEPVGSLFDVATGRMPLHVAAAMVGRGVRVLPAPPSQSYGGFSLRGLCPQEGAIIVDATPDSHGRLSVLARTADELVVVMQPTAASITATYAGLKLLQFTHAMRSFRFFVNAARSPAQAQLVTANIVATSSRYLTAALQPAGWVTESGLVAQAKRQHKSVSELYQDSDVAGQFRVLAAALMSGSGVAHDGAEAALSMLRQPAPAVV